MKNIIDKFNSKNIGISLLVSMYIFSGINKILNFNNISKELQAKFEIKFPVKLPLIFYKFTMILVISLLTCGSFILLLLHNIEIKYKNIIIQILSILFILFTLLATYLYHYPPVGHDLYAFMKNISIIGGFLIIYSSVI